MMRQDELISAIAEEVIKRLNGKVDKQNGKSLISNSELVRLAGLHNYDDTTVRGLITSEAETRANADTALSGRITGNANDITAIKGVVDVNNKKIKVATIEKDDNSNQITIADVASFSGQTYFNAKANFGLAAFSNTVDFSGIVTIDNDLRTELIYPLSDDTYDAGKSTNYYKNGYIKKVYTNEIVLGGSSITSTDKTAWDNKVDKVTGKGLSTNDFTNTYKQKVDTNETAIATETSRATTQENKALYHLGAFDSQDGKTRQTGYINKAECISQGTEYGLYSVSGIKVIHLRVNGRLYSDNDYVINFSGYTKTNIGSWGDMPNMSYNVYYDSNADKTILAIRNNGISDSDARALIETVKCEFKTTTSYTDTPIENQSILPLDTNMANKIRQKVVDGLNLWNIGYGTVYNANYGGDWYYMGSAGYCSVKPNTTYTISIDTAKVQKIQYCDSSMANISDSPQLSGTSNTFTTPSNCYYIRLTYARNGSYLSWVMLTDTNHPYPYSDYNQKEHITNAQAELLKGEEEKVRNIAQGFAITNKWAVADDVGTDFSFNGHSAIKDYIPVSAGATLVARCSDNNALMSFVFYNSSKTHLGFTASYNTSTFVVPSNAAYMRVDFGKEGVSSFYLSKHGEILHEVDIKPTLLWEYTGDSQGQVNNATLKQNINNFKYLKILAVLHIGNQETEWLEQLFTVAIDSNRPYKQAMLSFVDGAVNRNRVLWFSNTSLIINAIYNNGSQDSSDTSHIVVRKIYGTNIL